jgi:hypothetical protein
VVPHQCHFMPVFDALIGPQEHAGIRDAPMLLQAWPLSTTHLHHFSRRSALLRS